MDNKQNKKNADVEVGLIVVSVAILVAFIIFMIFNPESTLNVISSFFNLMISVLGPFFELIAVSHSLSVCICYLENMARYVWATANPNIPTSAIFR